MPVCAWETVGFWGRLMLAVNIVVCFTSIQEVLADGLKNILLHRENLLVHSDWVGGYPLVRWGRSALGTVVELSGDHSAIAQVLQNLIHRAKSPFSQLRPAARPLGKFRKRPS